MTIEIFDVITSSWLDITPLIAWQGVTFSRNDVDSSDSGRDMSGLMHRGRVAVKEKMQVQTIQLRRDQLQRLLSAIYPMSIMVRVTPYPLTNASHTMSMYTNNVKVTYTMQDNNGEELQSVSFPLIEN